MILNQSKALNKIKKNFNGVSIEERSLTGKMDLQDPELPGVDFLIVFDT